MTQLRHLFWMAGGIYLLNAIAFAGQAQIVPDSTLPINSIITTNGSTNAIEGGTQAGSNLFHSFREFSVPTGGTAFFNNTLDIQNIFTRISGGAISNIDGIIKANGTANLFLLNPNGIIFGPNAQLNIGGSFLASTASAIDFANGTKLSATSTQNTPLLTISVPIGLQLGANPQSASILVQGSNLSVQTGKTLALLGGDITIFGSTNPLYRGLTAGGIPLAIVAGNPVATTPGGRIELGSVTEGNISLTATQLGLALDYAGIENFGNIQMSGGATVDTSGTGGGEIQIAARNLRLNEGSRITSITLGSDAGRTITVNASESVEITGTGEYDRNVLQFVSGSVSSDNLRNGFFTLSLGSGSAGNILINTRQFNASNGTFVATSTFGLGKGGDVTINATNSVDLSASFVATGTGVGDAGAAGNLTINTRNFRGRDNAIATTSSIGAGKGGQLTVNATDAVELIGSNPIPLAPGVRVFTGFFTSGLGTGDAGELQVNTGRLTVLSGAGLAASSFFQGRGGNIIINVPEAVELIGSSPDGTALSSVAAVTEPGSTGNGGNLTLNTGRLILQDGGRLSVRSRGTGRTGDLNVTADLIFMINEGGFEGTAVSGEGADITVRSRSLQMSDNSFISATAGTEDSTGNGGNIIITTDTLVALRNSNITANAFKGNGGNIQINTQGIFNTPDSSITASSNSGVSGVVEVRTPDSKLQNALAPLLTNFVVPDTLLTNGCLVGGSRGQGNFIVTGTGGLPSNPYDSLSSRYNLVGLSGMGRVGEGERGRVGERSPIAIEEAQGIVVTPDGRTMLVTSNQMSTIASANNLICHSP